ncbi:MAG: two-component regulator propeller domain-containing protein [Chitinophagaceae bacterium]
MPHPRLHTFLIMLLLVSCTTLGQDTKQYSFTHYSPAGGLASNETTSVIQDETGFIWIGTNNGLQRFDGSRYITFRRLKNDSSTVPHSLIQQLLFDKQKRLWVLTGDGKVGIFDTRQFTYKEVPIDDISDWMKLGERRLSEDGNGNFFIHYFRQSFVTLDKESNRFNRKANFIPLPDETKLVSFIHQKGSDNYWMGHDSGFQVYNSKLKKTFHPSDKSPANPLIPGMGTFTFPQNVFFDANNRFWFDSWIDGDPNVFLYDLNKKEFIVERYTLDIREYHETRGYMQQRDGSVWIRGLGVFGRFLEKEKKIQRVSNEYSNEQSISFEGISDFCEDREDNIWVTTGNNGLYRFSPASQFFTNIPHTNREMNAPGKGSVMSFIQTADGGLLAGTWNDGLYRYDRNLNPTPLNIKGFKESASPWMWGMSASLVDTNIIWMGSQPGIFKVNQQTRSVEYFNPPAFKNRTIRQVVEDRYGNLWIGTQSIGLLKWNAAKGKKTFSEGISNVKDVTATQVVKLFLDKAGFIWVGTTGQGVYLIDPSTDKVIQHFGMNEPPEKRLLWHSASGIIQYDDSTIVIGAGGLHFYNTKQQRITRAIPNPQSTPAYITAIERDRTGYIWVSSTGGIFRVNPKNGIFIHFDRIDGIANDHFIPAASYVLPDGRIIFGSDNQIVIFNPDEVKINNPSPDIVITGIKVMNKPLLADSVLAKGTIQLNAHENSITFEFSGLSYNATYRISYKMEDIDKDWRIADNTNQAIYTYLPPGKYTFLLRSEDAEGNIGKNITRIPIVITPHFWQTWWFYSLLVLLAITVLYWIDRERVERLKALQKVRTEIANNLHKDVTTTLSHINLLGEMAKIKADKDINRSKEYIDQISSKSQNMIVAMDDILWSIDPENDSMEKTILRMMEFTDAMKQRYGSVIELSVDKKIHSLKMDMKVRNEFFLVFKEGLRMIAEYAQGRDTLINIDIFRNKLSLKLQDATARMDSKVDDIERCIREINSRSKNIHAEADIQYDKNGIAIILLIPV